MIPTDHSIPPARLDCPYCPKINPALFSFDDRDGQDCKIY